MRNKLLNGDRPHLFVSRSKTSRCAHAIPGEPIENNVNFLLKMHSGKTYSIRGLSKDSGHGDGKQKTTCDATV
jgi:hypothetical protein